MKAAFFNDCDYYRLMRHLEAVEREVEQIATKYGNSSLAARFRAVNVLDTEIPDAIKMHFISRRQASF